ncbi:TetR/AcrR family transcriptional regulator [Saccharothrix sp. HUAS TT1]|uniref:TetR/AcrR family transcriptional regulator n=1 Tax=unclassified Saccharothrix TaxID=2593673 RepID=UPI00345BF49A
MLGVAEGLFSRNGIRATGVDLVAAEAGVAPTTLYRLFSSKDGLVGAYVERADQEFRAMYTEVIAAAGPEPRDQVLALFDFVYAQISSERFRGCALLRTLAEFRDPELPGHRNAMAAKAWIRQSIGDLTDRLGVEHPAELADHLTLVLEGLYASGQSLGRVGPAKRARRLAEVILANAEPRSDGAEVG